MNDLEFLGGFLLIAYCSAFVVFIEEFWSVSGFDRFGFKEWGCRDKDAVGRLRIL